MKKSICVGCVHFLRHGDFADFEYCELPADKPCKREPAPAPAPAPAPKVTDYPAPCEVQCMKAWRKIFALCVSFGMETPGEQNGIQDVESFIRSLAQRAVTTRADTRPDDKEAK